MRRLVVMACLIVLAGLVDPAGLSPARSDELPVAEQAAIQGVIQAQLDAFNRDDGALAYSFAAPGIQMFFPSAEIFMAMVRDGYPPVYRSREVEFRATLPLDGSHTTQQALIVGQDGTVVLALYTMERGNDGVWRIAGCRLAQSNEAGA